VCIKRMQHFEVDMGMAVEIAMHMRWLCGNGYVKVEVGQERIRRWLNLQAELYFASPPNLPTGN
jgi:hypothetical protein